MAELTTRLVAHLIDKVSAPARGAANAMQSFYRAAGDGTGLSRVNERMAAVNRRLDQVRGSMLETAAAAYALKSALQSPIQSAVEFETKLTDIGQKSDKTREQLLSFGQAMRTLAPTVNQSALSLANAMDVLVGKGMPFEVAQKALPAIARAATAFRADMDDLAKASMAVIDNLKVSVDDLSTSLDIMAAAGNAGAFELKDMAQYMPKLAAGAAMQGMKGTSAVLELSAALQVVMKSAGDASEASTDLMNVFQKMRSQEVANNFKKVGIDLNKALDTRIKSGMSPLMAIVDVTRAAIAKGKGKIRISDLFADAQLQIAMAALTQNFDSLQDILKKTRESFSGLTDAQFTERMKDMAQKTKALSIVWDNFLLSVGFATGPVLVPLLTKLTAIADKIGQLAERFPNVTAGVTAAIGALIGLRFASVAGVWAFLQMQAGWLVAVAAFTKGTAFIQTAWAVVRVGSALMAVAVSEAFAGMATTAAASVGGVVSAAAAIGRAFVALGAAIAASPVGWVAAAAATIAAVGYLVWNNWDKITGWVTRGAEAAKGAASGLLDGVLKKAGEWGAEITDAFRKVVGWIDGAFLSFDWASVGARIISGITSGIAAAWSAVTGWINRAMQAATDTTGGFLDAAKRRTSEWGASIRSAFETVARRISDVFTQTDWLKVGRDILSGIWDGIRNSWFGFSSWLADSIRKLGGLLVGSAQAAVGGSGTSMGGDTGGGAGAGGAGGGVNGTEAPAPGEPGQYRPVYKLTNDDLSDDVVNKVAGEAIANNQTSVDAVINNMLNRVGTKAYGPSGNLRQVALAPGQYAGYRRAGAAEAEFIRSRIRAIASGAVPDNTGGANEYRAASYMGPWGRKHANAPVIGGNRFAYNPAGGVGPYAAYKEPRVGQGAVQQGNDAPGSGRQQITSLGRELQAQGIRVSEHPAFGGVKPVHKGRAHYEGRAIDLNIGRGVTEAFSPFAKKFDALAASLRDRGYKVIWRAPGHFNHMHVEAPAGGVPARAAPPAATAVAGRPGAAGAQGGGQGPRRIFDRNQQRASRDKTSSNVHFNPVVTVHAGQGVDSRDVERRVHAVMRNEVRTLFRGSYTDTDFATA